MKIVFMGTPEFGVPSLRALAQAGHEIPLVVTQPDRVRGRGSKPEPAPIKRAAEELKLRVIEPEKLSAPEAVKALREVQPEAIVVVAYGALLPADILSLPGRGCINGHASLLPRYRGAAPIPHAILNAEATTGVTTMLMEEGLDTGPILLQREVEILPADTTATLSEKLSQVTASLLVETLSRLEDGSLQPQPQDHRQATYAPRLRKEDGRIDWRLPAEKIALMVRAFDPWPSAFFTSEGETIKVWGAQVEEHGGREEPGIVLAADKGGILVACGQGALRLLELQAPGRRRLSAAEFLAGRPLHPGSRL